LVAGCLFVPRNSRVLDFRLQREVDYRGFVDTFRLFNARFGEKDFVAFYFGRLFRLRL
jgi:hypothetical protein